MQRVLIVTLLLALSLPGRASLAQNKTDKQAKPTAPPTEIIASAKTLCIWQTSGNPAMKAELHAKLSKWGKLTLISAPEEADLVFEVVQTGSLEYGSPGSAASGAGLLRDLRSGLELWSVKKGGYWAMSGYSISKVARQIGDTLIKFLESQGQPGKPKKQ